MLVKQAAERTEVIKQRNPLWRAQLGCSWRPEYYDNQYIDDFPAPFGKSRMLPLPDRAREGRANPKGIPYLYCATHKETAMAEVRPWKDSFISLAQFETLRDLRIVDCAWGNPKRKFVLEGELPRADWNHAVWADIDGAFSVPVSPSDDLADYVPTQIIAEFFKVHGWDGLAYRSSLGEGHNIALFELTCARPKVYRLFDVKSVKFEFAESGNAYIERSG
jgi:RES domain.